MRPRAKLFIDGALAGACLAVFATGFIDVMAGHVLSWLDGVICGMCFAFALNLFRAANGERIFSEGSIVGSFLGILGLTAIRATAHCSGKR